MNDNVVELKPTNTNDPRIWTCGCGSQQFYLYEDSTTECYICGTTAPNGNWRDNVKEDPGTKDVEIRSSTHYGTAEFARAALMKKAKDDPNALAVGIVYRDGQLSAWSDAEDNAPTDEQRSWLRRRFAALAALILNEPEPQYPDSKEPKNETE